MLVLEKLSFHGKEWEHFCQDKKNERGLRFLMIYCVNFKINLCELTNGEKEDSEESKMDRITLL